MPSNIIQWYPGHMAKTKRLIKENLDKVDFVLELLDARIPQSSKNPDLMNIVGTKPIITILNKCSLADEQASALWQKEYENRGGRLILTDCISGKGMDKIYPAAADVLAEKLDRYKAKGMNRPLRAMVLGIPNVGKSSLINRLCKRKKAEVEDRPGVTLNKQWVKTDIGLELLDMPGVLWPKFDDRRTGESLAVTGAIKDGILEIEEIAVILCRILSEVAPQRLCERYKLDDISELEPYDIFLSVGAKRGMLIRGGEVDERRCAVMLLDEFRGGKLGGITLELP